MRLDNRQFNLLAVTALAAVSAHLARLPIWLSVPLVLIAPLRMSSRAKMAATVPAWLRLPLILLLIAAIVIQYGNLFGREPGSALACGLLMLKLLESERTRDARAGAGFAAFVLMSALLFSQSLGFTVLVCSALILVLATMNALEPAPINPSRSLRSAFHMAVGLVLIGLPLAAAAFLFVPRPGSPLWGSPGGSLARTGLDDRMAPGSMTDLLVDDSPALRVQFDGDVPPPAKRYFRALVLWDFDGTTWSREARPERSAIEQVVVEAPPIDYSITLEPTDRPWLVAMDIPLSSTDGIRMSHDRSLSTRGRRVDQLREYRARSALAYRLAPQIDARDRSRALSLPDGFNPRTLELARQWRREGRDDRTIVREALAMFDAKFSYTLAAPLLGRHSVDDFLFETQAGYCEHFSSAFVVLMRAAGIPARVVTGYQGGWWSTLGDYLLVRLSDAHAWSEVWLEGRGWVRIDPTAAVNPARVEREAGSASADGNWEVGSWLLGVRNQFDVINRLWTQTILEFNTLRQGNLLQPLGIERADQGDLLLSLAIAFALFLMVGTLWVLYQGRRRNLDPLDEAWLHLARRMAGRDAPIGAAEGPMDFLRRCSAGIMDPAAKAALEQIVQRYITLRYAVIEPDPAEVQAFRRRIREFRLPRGVTSPAPASAAQAVRNTSGDIR
jgi:transglutaminase-like putative cysteine protease